MSTKRILGLTVFGVVFIAVIIGILAITSLFRSDDGVIVLPERPEVTASPDDDRADGLDRVEVTRDTVQAIIETLNRPEVYSRSITVRTYWDGGNAEHDIDVNVKGDVTSLSISLSGGDERRIIVTSDRVYIWNSGDDQPHISARHSDTDPDEFQMIFTYEDILALAPEDIVETGFKEFGGELCIYVVYDSPIFGFRRRYYVSVEIGLVTGARVYDGAGEIIYVMTTGESTIGEADMSAFILPDGFNLFAIPMPHLPVQWRPLG